MTGAKKIKYLLILIPAIWSINSFAAADSVSGEKLFRDNCSACHQVGTEVIGPDLAGITSNRSRDWLTRFIRNSQSVIKSGDPYAVELFRQYKQVIMPETHFTGTETDSILAYIERETKAVRTSQETTGKTISPVKEIPEKTILHKRLLRWSIIAGGLLILLFPFLFLGLKQKFRPVKPGDQSSFAHFVLLVNEFLTKRVPPVFYVINGIILLILLVALNYNEITARTYVMQKQVVEFSHSRHTDSIATDCIFCHDGARKNTNAGLPSVKNCMKCHSYIIKGKKYGKTEIAKLRKISDSSGEIHWATGFRYNDYVHFDHSIHFISGKLECKRCHEDPENMEVRKAAFTMRWCIDCHKVSFINQSSKYYKKQLEKPAVTGNVSVSEAGGINCIQCHY